LGEKKSPAARVNWRTPRGGKRGGEDQIFIRLDGRKKNIGT